MGNCIISRTQSTKYIDLGRSHNTFSELTSVLDQYIGQKTNSIFGCGFQCNEIWASYLSGYLLGGGNYVTGIFRNFSNNVFVIWRNIDGGHYSEYIEPSPIVSGWQVGFVVQAYGLVYIVPCNTEIYSCGLSQTHQQQFWSPTSGWTMISGNFSINDLKTFYKLIGTNHNIPEDFTNKNILLNLHLDFGRRS